MNYKGVSFPFRFSGGGGVATSELTPDDIARIEESITQIILTMPGERLMNPDFGCKVWNYVFENTGDPTISSIMGFWVKQAIERWEDRVVVENIVVFADPENDGTIVIEVYVKIIKYDLNHSFQIRIEEEVINNV